MFFIYDFFLGGVACVAIILCPVFKDEFTYHLQQIFFILFHVLTQSRFNFSLTSHCAYPQPGAQWTGQD